jgi:prephenate dehydratase
MLGQTKIPVKRPVEGSYVKGRWVEGANPIPFTITGSVQPTSGDKLQTLLEGKRVSSIYEIITDTKLEVTDPLTGKTGDIVTIFGQDHEVIQCMPWQNNILPHYSCIAIREKEALKRVDA